MSPAPRLPRSWLVAIIAALAALLVPVGLVLRSSETGAPPEAAPSPPPVPPPACEYGARATPFDSHDDWDRTFLDPVYRLPGDYEPPDLVSTQEAGFDGDHPVRELVIPDLIALREAAQEAGNPIDVSFGYRTWDLQKLVFEEWKAREGEEYALKHVARPGHSEHQLGTALDFKSRGAPSVDRTWRYDPAGAWMRENAWRFGFIETYPLRREDITCYEYEPWHFRYFGPVKARHIQESGLTAREYLWPETLEALEEKGP